MPMSISPCAAAVRRRTFWQIAVRDFTTTVDFTQVTYTMPRTVIEVKNNHLIAEGVPLYDPEKNEGLFSIDLNLEHLSNISYSVKVLPKELMVLNTTSKDNDLFYGRIFASGSATIAGSKGGVKMDIVATTEGDSEFYMPLSGQSNAKTADFVTFVTLNRSIRPTIWCARSCSSSSRGVKRKPQAARWILRWLSMCRTIPLSNW